MGVHEISALLEDAIGGTIRTGVARIVVHPEDALIARPDAYTILEDEVLQISAPGILANDILGPDINPDIEIVTPPAHGQMLVEPDGSFEYRPDLNFFGTDRIEYRLVLGERVSDTVEIRVTVLAVNDPPVVEDVEVTLNEDGVIDIRLEGSDPDGDLLTYRIVEAPMHGVAVQTGPSLQVGHVRYRPGPYFNGTDSFTYAASDGRRESAPDVVRLNILDVANAPVAHPDHYSVAVGTPLRIGALDGVLANDEHGDKRPMTVELVSPPKNGQLELSPDGSFVYQPAEGFTGLDLFGYKSVDGIRSSPEVHVRLGVGNERWFTMPREHPGAMHQVHAITTGPSGELYVGIERHPGNDPQNTSLAQGVLRWDGQWTGLGQGEHSGVFGIVYALTWWKGHLYAGGDIWMAGGRRISGIARWDGHAWEGVGTGIHGVVRAFITSDDALYAGGQFRAAGGVRTENVARWDGESWSAVGNEGSTGGVQGTVHAMAITSDNRLVVAGEITRAGTLIVRNIATWDGVTWKSTGFGANGPVYALEVDDNDVYVGGDFTVAGNLLANNVARFNANGTWSTLGGGLPLQSVASLKRYKGRLMAGGRDDSGIATVPVHVWSWNGTSWTAMGEGFTGAAIRRINAIEPTSQGFWAGGDFSNVGTSRGRALAFWDDASWLPATQSILSTVQAIAYTPEGLYIGGDRLRVGALTANSVVRWDGRTWHSPGEPFAGEVHALVRGPDGAVYAAGNFTRIGLNSINRVARWDGSRWSPLGGGLDDRVNCLVFGEDGTLYAGGHFTTASGRQARYVAAWKDGEWQEVGGGVGGVVYALAWDSGSLYVGGGLRQAGGNSADRLARWDGSMWHAIGGGLNTRSGGARTVRALAVRGADVYVGGDFSALADGEALNLAHWDGTTWHALVRSMEPYERVAFVQSLHLEGDDLYVGGPFRSINGIEMPGLAIWNGSRWRGPGSGLTISTESARSAPLAYAMQKTPLGIVIGGSFSAPGRRPSSGLAVWATEASRELEVALVHPQPGQPLQLPGQLVIEVSEDALPLPAARIEVFSGDRVLAWSDHPPHRIGIGNLSPGLHCLRVRVISQGALPGPALESREICISALADESRQPAYSITPIHVPSTDDFVPIAMNNQGDVVGTITEPSSAPRPFFYSRAQGSLTVIESLGAGLQVDGAAFEAINDAGWVAGTAMDAAGIPRGFVWRDGVTTPLPDLDSEPEPEPEPAGEIRWQRAWAIDPEGGVHGETRTQADIPRSLLFLHDRIDAPAPWDVSDGVATAINEAGDLTGYILLPEDGTRAVVRSRGDVLRIIETFGGTVSRAFGINAGGWVTGESEDAWGHFRPMLARSEVPADLGTLGGQSGTGRAINRWDQVVGTAKDALGRERAFIWLDGVMHDLNDLLIDDSTSTLIDAIAINDAGQIAVIGESADGGSNRTAFLLSPMTRPSTGITSSRLVRVEAGRIYLAWTVPPGQASAIEASTDFKTWRRIATDFTRTGLVRHSFAADNDNPPDNVTTYDYFRVVPLAPEISIPNQD